MKSSVDPKPLEEQLAEDTGDKQINITPLINALVEDVEKLTEEQDPLLADENPVTENGQDALDEEVEQVDEAKMGDTGWKKSTGPKKDRFGNIIKDKNRPKNLAKRGMAAVKKEEVVDEKTLTPAEKKKREEVAKAIERDNPKMPMDKKMAIATATAKKVAENIEDRHADAYERVTKHLDKVKSPEHKAKFQKKLDTHLKSFDYHYEKDTGQEHHAVDDMHDLANDIKKHNSKMSESSISDRTKRLIERAINRKS